MKSGNSKVNISFSRATAPKSKSNSFTTAIESEGKQKQNFIFITEKKERNRKDTTPYTCLFQTIFTCNISSRNKNNNNLSGFS
jgi:hypothetical protein